MHWKKIHRKDTSTSKKRSVSAEKDDDNDTQSTNTHKKPRTDESGKVMESILDDIRLEDIDTRITVHVIESPASCTHEVAVYPG